MEGNLQREVPLIRLEVVQEKSLPYAEASITSPHELASLARSFLGNPDREVFLLVCLNTRNRPTALHVVSVGSLNQTTVHPREVFKAAILANSAAVAFVHNHPSGDPQPSEADLALTKKLVDCGSLLGIPVLDHLILTPSQVLSFRDQQLGGL